MSIVSLDAETIISSVVESMLPRFSDNKLGLLISLQTNLTDYGYGLDGDTIERESLDIRSHYYFLFLRPNNYTKVYLWIAKPDSVGLMISPIYNKEDCIWTLECDHDSCWRSSGLRHIVQSNFVDYKKFEGRMISGRELNWNDLSIFNCFSRDPQYVEIDNIEQIDPLARRHSIESRPHKINFHPINFTKLEMFDELDLNQMQCSGLFIKGSEDHQRRVLMVKNK